MCILAWLEHFIDQLSSSKGTICIKIIFYYYTLYFISVVLILKSYFKFSYLYSLQKMMLNFEMYPDSIWKTQHKYSKNDWK